jgi:hypothetical protein
MMDDPQTSDNHDSNVSTETIQTNGVKYKRPHGLSILLIFSMVYSGFMFLLLTAGLFYKSIVRQILEQYYEQLEISQEVTFLVNLSATVLFGISIFGLIKLWLAQKSGFWYFSASQFIILFSIVVFLRSYDWINIGIASGIVIIVGLYVQRMK